MQPSLTISEWCALRKVSRSMFYNLDNEGLAPKTHNVGVKRLISPDADAERLRQRDAGSGREFNATLPSA